ncbi:hypothetical protein A4R40_18540 [Photorhabdus laumondii subsp. laumondii]|nr:hypothetical protein A4R40_18540 [Photorhabdus laumondii subsp. laumondii]
MKFLGYIRHKYTEKLVLDLLGNWRNTVALIIMIFMYQKDFYALKAVFLFESQILAMFTRRNRRTELSLYAVFTGKSEHDQHTMIFFTTRLRKDGAINTGLNKIERLW